MPRSRRQRVKPLTQVKPKKSAELKQRIVESIREAVDNHESAYAFAFNNMRTNHFKDVRLEFRDSRFFLGKNKVMKLALGRSKEDEYADNLFRVGNDLNGNVGLLFTDRSKEEVIAYFESLSITDYPRSGFVATETVEVEAGDLPQFIGSMVESLRTLGLPVDLKKGKVVLNQKHTICKAGQTLTPEQAKLLMHFEKKMAEFKLTPLSVWSKDGTYQRLAAASVNAGGDDEDEDEDM